MAQPLDIPTLIPRRRPYPWLRRVLVFATIVVFVDALFGEHGLVETIRARRQYAEAAGRLAAMTAENDRLRERVRDLLANPRAIDAEARRELGFVKPGEILFVVRDR